MLYITLSHYIADLFKKSALLGDVIKSLSVFSWQDASFTVNSDVENTQSLGEPQNILKIRRWIDIRSINSNTRKRGLKYIYWVQLSDSCIFKLSDTVLKYHCIKILTLNADVGMNVSVLSHNVRIADSYCLLTLASLGTSRTAKIDGVIMSFDM